MDSRAIDKGSIRQKSAFSCEQCRRRKLKCDTRHPACSRCISKGENCDYRLAPSISYTQKLEDRIRVLEAALAERTPLRPDEPRLRTPSTSTDVAEPPGLKRDNLGHVSFHGRTSLVHEVTSRAPVTKEQTPRGSSDSDQSRMELINSAWTERALESLSNLPETVQFLLQFHWCWVQPLFNFVYRPAFTRDLMTGGKYCSVLLLNTVLSHSVRWVRSDDHLKHILEPFESGAYFARQARASLMDSLQSGPPSIPTTQALLLLSAQEFGQGNLTQAWLYSGMAFRLIEDLGIVFDGHKYAGSLQFSAEELEIRNRLFWSCYFWDKLISLYLGRTPVIQQTSVSPPRNIMDDTSESDIWVPHGLAPSKIDEYPPMQAYTTSCFISTCALSEILNAILVTMYNPSKETNLAEVAVCAEKEEERLERWYEELPSHLKIPLFNLPEHCPPSHIVTLNCLYNTTKILLSRPLITTYSKHQSLAGSQNEHHLRQCVESANAILILHILFCKSFGAGRAIMSQSYSCYTAASIFLLQVQATRNTNSQAMESLRYSVDALEQLQTTHPVLRSALNSIYRALQELDPDMITKDADGNYHMWSSRVDPAGDAQDRSINTSVDVAAAEEPGHQTVNFDVLDFDNLEMPPDMFDVLPGIEPISANVNAALDIGLDGPWYLSVP